MEHKLYLIKFISIILVLSFFLIPSFSYAATSYKLGDINGDNNINAADALLALQHAVKKITLNGSGLSAANVDGANGVTATDALYILQYSVKKIEKFPAEDINPGAESVEWLQGVSGYAATTPAYIPDEGEITTLYQCNMGYSGAYAVEADCVLAYVYGKSGGGGGIMDSWKEAASKMYNGDGTVGIMIPANRDNAEYLELHPERGVKDIQTTSDGTFRQHSTMNNKSIYYMVPTESYMQYKWEAIESYLQYGCKVVAIEEPEIWNNAAYSEGFKEEWLKYYGTEWEDQATSPDAMYKSQELKAYLFKREIEYIADNIKASYPDVTVLIATHSVINYSRHGISTGISMYANIDSVDGIIGQTWSDGVTMTFPYGGANSVHTFAAAMYEYNSYGEFLPEGKSLYLLQDPASDQSLPAEVYENNWKMTVVASLMQQDTQYSQCTIWPQRAYLPMGMDYKVVQQSVYKMYNELAGLDSKVYSGTKGVCFGLSDTASWSIGSAYTTSGNCLASICGVAFSLVYDGVPVDTVCLDTLTSVDQLSGVNLLILSYDSMKPMSETVNDVIAQWVKAGGRLLYLGGHDGFSELESQWWGKKGTTPLKDLFDSLGLSDIQINKGVDRGTIPVWSGSSIAATDSLNSNYANSTYTFSGKGFETFMTAGNKNAGITVNCGEGKIVCVGLPSAIYATSLSMETVVRELAALALKGTDTEYASSSFYTVSSGNYMAYFSWFSANNKTAENKTYVDLFNADLKIIKGGSTLLRNTPVLYYDISSYVNGNTPKLAFTNGVEVKKPVETTSATTFTVASPTSSVFASVLVGNGKYPQKITAVTKSGVKGSVITMWDKENGSLLVKCGSNDLLDPVTVTVEWGDTYVELDTNYEYMSYFHATQNKTINEDIFLYDYNCHMNDGLYFCDLDTYCIWEIDLDDYKDASMTMDIQCNYVISVSFDAENWTVVEDYSTIGEFTKDSSNRKTLTVASTNYPAAANADKMYVKLSSCYMDTETNPGRGWGGAIISYTVNYLAPVS